MKTKKMSAVPILTVVVAALFGWNQIRQGFSARAKHSRIEMKRHLVVLSYSLASMAAMVFTQQLSPRTTQTPPACLFIRDGVK